MCVIIAVDLSILKFRDLSLSVICRIIASISSIDVDGWFFLFHHDRSKKYDIFLSFRGEDTRNGFTSHLHAALCRKKISTFIDNQIVRGDEISSFLLNTIKASKISVIIFSKNYASSRWCLQELEQILHCKKIKEQIVIPVFYHVDPSDVRNQTGSFGDGFAELENRTKEKLEMLQRWKTALNEAASLAGWNINNQKELKQYEA
ncbi:TMV resistance protein N-like [Pistacia vera]|uniref:TMV resistance protein N-like n=1 Tax=Pistacia vera TaxID=55513 RepID=UPI0012634613|nr:TMV resistance protein N-like [Pistacia vera]